MFSFKLLNMLNVDTLQFTDLLRILTEFVFAVLKITYEYMMLM